MEVELSNKNKISQKTFYADRSEENICIVDKITVWATLILVPWFLIYFGYHVVEAFLAGRL